MTLVKLVGLILGILGVIIGLAATMYATPIVKASRRHHQILALHGKDFLTHYLRVMNALQKEFEAIENTGRTQYKLNATLYAALKSAPEHCTKLDTAIRQSLDNECEQRHVSYIRLAYVLAALLTVIGAYASSF